MKAKVANIIATLDAHHRVSVKLDKSCVISQLTITEGKGGYTVGSHPGSKLRKYSKQEVVNLLNENSFFIQSWKAI